MYVDLGLAILRVAVGGIALAHGLQKLGWLGGSGQVGTTRMLAGFGFKPANVWAAVLAVVESVGGALTVAGLFNPLGPSLIVADMIVAIATVHWPRGFFVTAGGIEFALLEAVGASSIGLAGSGAWSLDGLLGSSMPDYLAQGWLAIVIVGTVLAFASRSWVPAEPSGSREVRSS